MKAKVCMPEEGLWSGYLNPSHEQLREYQGDIVEVSSVEGNLLHN